jgi:hypothetical protein
MVRRRRRRSAEEEAGGKGKRGMGRNKGIRGNNAIVLLVLLADRGIVLWCSSLGGRRGEYIELQGESRFEEGR